jgi:hypothetical protein
MALSPWFITAPAELTEETYLASKIFKAGLKSNNVDGNPDVYGLGGGRVYHHLRQR